MKTFIRIAAAAALLAGLQAVPSFAQSTGTDTLTPAPAASPAPAPAANPVATPAPATPAPTAAAPATPPAAATDAPPPADKAATKEPAPKHKKRKMTRQQEIDHSIDSGTVPSRYRSQVPREYQKYIPFEK